MEFEYLEICPNLSTKINWDKNLSDIENLNILGEDGWELIHLKTNENHNFIHLVLKREVPYRPDY